MIRRLYTTIFATIFCCFAIYAQNLSVASFKPLDDDLTANLAGTMEKDHNGDVAALIKVVTTQTGFTFEGGMAGIVKVQQRTGEIWVYVPHGIKKISILHQNLGVLRNYYFPCAIESARTYELVLTSGEVRTTVKQDLGVQYLALTVAPKNAIVYIDDEMMPVDGSGEYLKAMTYGEHNYRVEATGYAPEAGVIQIGNSKKMLNVSLKSVMARLSVATATADTKIFINEQAKGVDKWTGELNAGTYILEGRKDGHRSQKLSVSLSKQENKQITIPALEPIYGTLNVSFKPLGAEVWLDNKLLGSSPDIFKEVLIGKHNLTIKKDGYINYTNTINLAEGEVKDITGTLQEGSGKSLIEADSALSKKVFLKNFIDKVSGIYNIVLGETTMEEVATRFNIKPKKGKTHNELHLKDGTEFIDIYDDGIIGLMSIDPQEIKDNLPRIGLEWKSSYDEWNKWFNNNGFEQKKYKPYFQKQSSLCYVEVPYTVVLLFDGGERKRGSWFSLIMSKEIK